MLHYQSQNDETLVMLTLAGEQNAYEVLVTRYQKMVIAAAAAVTHNQFMAEDAAQDAFVTAWMKLDTLQEPQKFAAWVCRISKNCALNMVTRFRSFLPLDIVENQNMAEEPGLNPAEAYVLSEEKDELHQSIGNLPAKVKQIIRLHYFEGLSIAEIADRMRISPGTVKWQLHDGRKRIRKELCAMNEKYSDTLVQRVMKKVEELKLWQVKVNKNGFGSVYRDVLREVEELPESGDKYHALADVLMRGWWWLPGEKNDALFARIKEAALLGKNDEVMEFIVTREDMSVYGGAAAAIDFIRNHQIPMLEKAGLVHALAREWFWLGYQYFRENRPEEGFNAYDRVREILKPSDAYYALVPYAREMEQKLSTDYNGKNVRQYQLEAAAEEFRYIDGALYYWKEERYGEGYICSADRDMLHIFRNSFRCDGRFMDAKLAVGETCTGSDGTTLTFASDCETVETPCGTFRDCRLWITTSDDQGHSVWKSYYKKGIGIVRHEHTLDGITDVRVLKDYHIAGGGEPLPRNALLPGSTLLSGNALLPLAAGNTWEYVGEYAPDVMGTRLKFQVSYADEKKVILSSGGELERLRYDGDSWLDTMEQIRNEYCKTDAGGREKICDVSDAVRRAEALAKTPVEKAHTKAACSVARRIMETDPAFNPNHTATGHWNFFEKCSLQHKGSRLTFSHSPRWSFEWKNTGGMGDIETPLLYNDIYGILQDAVNCIWSDEWRTGASPLVEYMLWESRPVKTRIICEEVGKLTTKAGTFDHCLALSLDIEGFDEGWAYRGGKKKYYFAEGIGIVRTEHEYCNGAKKTVYELTSYTGAGEGYMPFADGMVRRYDALGLTDGFVGAAEYTYVRDKDGQIAVFADRTGIRQIPAPITQYSFIQGEVLEDKLWEERRYDESRLRHDINNFHLLAHFLDRPQRYWAMPEKAAAWNKYRLQLLEGLNENGEIPPAWLGYYAGTCFRTACALFGCIKTREENPMEKDHSREEGYEYLERSFEFFPKWNNIADGEELEVGNPLIYGGVRVVKGKGILKLPDGTYEPISYKDIFHDNINLPYYGLTATRGWEWFNSVRNEERFKEYVERARELQPG